MSGNMEFGKYKEQSFKSVRQKDSQYLLWLNHKHIDRDYPPLHNYIESHYRKIQKTAHKEYIRFIDERCGGEVSIEY